MKSSRRSLLDTLKNKRSVNSEEIFANVKQALGSLANIAGNPLTKSEFSLNIDVFFCNPALNVLIAPAAVPAVNQTPLPVYFFGTNDMYNAYQKARFFAPINPNWFLAGSGFAGYNYNGVAINISFALLVEDGDYILHYAPQVGGANLAAMVRVRCENTGYSSIVHGLMRDTIVINTIRYSVTAASILQFNHPLIFTHIALLGKIASDTVDPRLFTLPTSPQQAIADIPIKIPFDNKMLIATQIDFNCQHFNWIVFSEIITK